MRNSYVSAFHVNVGAVKERGQAGKPVGDSKETEGSVSALSTGAFTATLYVMVIGVGLHPHPHQPGVDFSIMLGCTPEIGNIVTTFVLWEIGYLKSYVRQKGGR
jgi:hypothetical protein